MNLHLGVLDFPYIEEPGVTTGNVALWLEAKYGIMFTYYLKHEDFITFLLTDALEGQLENLLMGGPQVDVQSMFNSAASGIKKDFDLFLSSQEAERVGITGTPTQAALDGVQTALKSKHGPRRPSFIDTGLYRASFIAWVDE